MKTAEMLQLVKEIASHEYDSTKRPSVNYADLKEMAQKIVIDNIDQDFLTNKEEQYNWLFNWEGGGFNDTWASTKEEAIARVERECEEDAIKYPTHSRLKAISRSFRKSTRESANAQNRAGNMMSI